MTALTDRIAAISVAVVCVALFATSAAVEPRVNRTDGLAVKKEEAAPSPPPPPLLGTLVQTHTDERVPLDDATPTFTRFDALLADRATGTSAALDPRLLGLLRTLATKYTTPEGGPPRIELVSGFRSPKLNEMMRKKGHHVASHSQHSLGHAVDFRIVVPTDAGPTAIDPRAIERAIRATGWDGGVGVYTSKDDWFVHAD
ncbi:MAG: YcbK family protein, partial [Polyangiaceae bacterium]